MRIPASANHPAVSIPKGAPPAMNSLARPPKAAWIFARTSLAASRHIADLGSRSSRMASRCRLPVAIAQESRRFLIAVSDARRSTSCRIFSYTRGTPTKMLGWTLRIAAGSLSKLAQYAIVTPCAKSA